MKLEKELPGPIYSFLKGGGEMGELMRNYDWSQTPVGSPGNWPQSLRTTVSILLSSSFPMFLWWGEELIQFYNDAYRPSLGNNGKHPGALGQKGKDCWPEIWHIIYPLIEQVRAGEATWSEDQLVPIYRNGSIEDVYWTFGYSPIRSESEKIEGILVVCTETTEKVEHLKEQMLARKKIEESEERFRTMAEGTDILIAVGDETSNAIYFNRAWVDLTGRPMNELLKFGWADLIHPEDREDYVNVYLSAFEKRQPFTGEFRILNKEGSYTWLLAKGPPRFRADGSFAGYISSCIDITERKQAEKAFTESEQRLRALVESAPFPIGVYIGREMRIALANQSIIKVWGKGNDVIGKLFGDILPELDNQEVLAQLDNVFTTGIPFHIRNQHLDLEVDGKLQSYYFNYSLTPLFDESGHIYGVMNTGADVTDLNMTKQKIEQSERNFRAMILQAPVAMCILLGPSHIVEVANELMIELWGKPVADVMNKPVFEGLPDAREQGLEQLLASVYRTGEAFTANERPVVLFRNGRFETVYQNFVYEPYRDADGTILGVLAISIDVTEQVLARQKIEEVVAERTKELAEANSELQKSNAELAQFAYIASHDLQEPVRKVSTYSQMLEKSLGDRMDSRSMNYLEKIKNSSFRMLTLIRDVLAYSQLSKENEEFPGVDLQKIISDIKTDFELLIEQKQACIECHGLPVIEAIPLQMAQLFGNLVSNALKFSRPGIPPEISITASALTAKAIKDYPGLRENTPYYRIEVKDNGIGFNQEHASQLFNIFQRLHGRKQYEGTGIGLAMCKKIVQNHHGHIYAGSETGKGSTFVIILPAQQAVQHKG